MAHPFADLPGLEIDTGPGGRSTSRLTAAPRHLNPNGVVHGTLLYALADSGMGAALSSVLADGEICSTIELKIDDFRPTLPGLLRCDTRTIHRGRRTDALESEVFDEQARLLARATGTFTIRAGEPPAPGG